MTAFSDVKLDAATLTLVHKLLGFFRVFRSVRSGDSKVSEKLVNIVNGCLIAVERKEVKDFFVGKDGGEVKFAVGESAGATDTHHGFNRFSFFYRVALFNDEDFFVFLFGVFIGGKETGGTGT